MKLNDYIEQISFAPQHRLKLSYQELTQCGLDSGFRSELRGDRDFHCLTQDIAVSFMYFHDGSLTTMVFSNGHPLRLDLDDGEIIPYFSDYIELRYIVRGDLEVEFESERARFHAGEFSFISSASYHRESVADSDCLLFNISVQRKFFTEAFLSSVSVAPLQQFLRRNLLRQSDHRPYLKFTPQSPVQAEAVQLWLYEILSEVTGRRAGYMDISRGYLIRVMDHLSTGYHDNLPNQESDSYSRKLFDSVSQFMKENIQSISMADLSAEFHFQPNYFNNLIKKHTGLTYSDYLIHLRMELARSFLENSGASVEEIMWLCGYSNKGFFYRKFTEHTGLSPSKYRAAHRQRR